MVTGPLKTRILSAIRRAGTIAAASSAADSDFSAENVDFFLSNSDFRRSASRFRSSDPEKIKNPDLRKKLFR